MASFTLSCQPTSWNVILTLHWAKRRKKFDELADPVRLQAMREGWSCKWLFGKGPFMARFTAMAGPRLGRGRGSQAARHLDCDNVLVKPILDSLKGWAFEEDNPNIIKEVRLRSGTVDREADSGIRCELFWREARPSSGGTSPS